MTSPEGMEVSQLKRRMEGLYSKPKSLDGTIKIILIKKLATLAKAFDAVGASLD